MPRFTRLVLTQLRNIQQAELEPAPGFNLLYGENGSGKTSLLEAIHLLALGRSFRSQQQRTLVMEGSAEATVFGETAEGQSFAVQKPLRGPQQIRIGGKRAESLAELSHQLPLQLLNSATFQILEGSPTERRRFLDWGVFHVEQNFLPCWRRARLALQQRNNLLKRGASAAELEPWTLELARSGEQMDVHRAAYVERLRRYLEPLLECFPELEILSRLELEYQRGWDQDGLFEQIQADLLRDRRYGHTGKGPHRAELRFRLGQADAAEVLSRGQLKVLIAALKIAQGQLLQAERGQHCLYLIDDLPAELDRGNRARVCAALAALKAQVFISSIEQESLQGELHAASVGGGREGKLFHVKHGKISAS